MRPLPAVLALLAVVASAAAGAAPTLVLSEPTYDVTFAPTDVLPLRHHVFYGGHVENAGANTMVFLQVVGRPAPGAPLSFTGAQEVPIAAPSGASDFRIEGTNLPFAHVCYRLVAERSNVAAPISNEVCTPIQTLQGAPLP